MKANLLVSGAEFIIMFHVKIHRKKKKIYEIEGREKEKSKIMIIIMISPSFNEWYPTSYTLHRISGGFPIFAYYLAYCYVFNVLHYLYMR